jgi:uracil-DNA glycosylase
VAAENRTKLKELYDNMQSCKECADIPSDIPDMKGNWFDRGRGQGFGKLRGYGGGNFMFVAQNHSRIRIPHIVTSCDAGVSRDLLWLLQKEGFENQDMFFTNLVKCSTPKSGSLLDEEVQVCTEAWLQREMEIIRPTLITPVGKPARLYFKGEVGIKTKYDRTDVFSILHPNYVFRSGKLDEFLGHLQELGQLRREMLGSAAPQAGAPAD